MPQTWQCQTCFRRFPDATGLHDHIEAFQVGTSNTGENQPDHLQSRVKHLMSELEKCLAHSAPCPDKTPQVLEDANVGSDGSEDDGGSDGNEDEDDDTDGDGEAGHVRLVLKCPCQSCPRNLAGFKRWKDLLRHYTIRTTPAPNVRL